MDIRAGCFPRVAHAVRCVASCALVFAGSTAIAFAAPRVESRAASAIASSAVSAQTAAAPDALAGFDATSLTGQPMVLIVTPSRDAAESTRAWAQALRDRLSTGNVRVRDLIAIDLPFFLSRDDAIARARDKIPARYHDMTWLSTDTTIERAFGIPRDASEATVLVLGADGKLHARASRSPSPAEVTGIVRTVQALQGTN